MNKYLKQIYQKLTYLFQFENSRLAYKIDRHFLFGDNARDNQRRGRMIQPSLQSCGENLTVVLGATIGDPKNIIIGNNVYIGLWAYLGVGPITIGDDVIIGPHCSLTGHNHDFAEAGAIMIEEHAWLGAGVCVTAGVRVGKYSVIGAGAVVTKDTQDYSVMAGVPARRIGTVNPQTMKIEYRAEDQACLL